MSTPEQRAKNDQDCAYLAKLTANGNPNAEAYLRQIGFVFRVVDDLIDKDAPVTEDRIMKMTFIFLAGLWQNPFVATNFYSLLALHVGAFNAWADATKWEKDPSRLKQVYSHVMRDFANEIYGYVASATGGYDHMRMVSEKVKETFIREVKNGPV